MKVALFHAMLPEPARKVGGVDFVVHRLANALIEYEKLEVMVFSCGPPPPGARYTHLRLFRHNRAGSKFWRFAILPLALNFVNFRGFDILHLHGDDWFFVNRCIPTVRTFHGSARQEARVADTLKSQALQYAIYPLEHLSARLATRTLAVGPEAKEIYRADYLADNGVDTALFAPRPKAPDPLLFYVGTWNGRKRGEFAFETFRKHVLPAFPSARLYMASDHAPEHDRVIRGGFPDDEELARWLAKAWVFLSPSVYEGFGIPYIEALASGTAIVTTRNTGAEYTLDRGRFGVICGDFEFGAAVVALLKDEERRAMFEARGRTYAARYSWREIAGQHSEIYRSVISGWRATFVGRTRGESHAAESARIF
jgi:phosphatidyl-myo-inositol alpha-mannosyltransferase